MPPLDTFGGPSCSPSWRRRSDIGRRHRDPVRHRPERAARRTVAADGTVTLAVRRRRRQSPRRTRSRGRRPRAGQDSSDTDATPLRVLTPRRREAAPGLGRDESQGDPGRRDGWSLGARRLAPRTCVRRERTDRQHALSLMSRSSWPPTRTSPAGWPSGARGSLLPVRSCHRRPGRRPSPPLPRSVHPPRPRTDRHPVAGGPHPLRRASEEAATRRPPRAGFVAAREYTRTTLHDWAEREIGERSSWCRAALGHDRDLGQGGQDQTDAWRRRAPRASVPTSGRPHVVDGWPRAFAPSRDRGRGHAGRALRRPAAIVKAYFAADARGATRSLRGGRHARRSGGLPASARQRLDTISSRSPRSAGSTSPWWPRPTVSRSPSGARAPVLVLVDHAAPTRRSSTPPDQPHLAARHALDHWSGRTPARPSTPARRRLTTPSSTRAGTDGGNDLLATRPRSGTR